MCLWSRAFVIIYLTLSLYMVLFTCTYFRPSVRIVANILIKFHNTVSLSTESYLYTLSANSVNICFINFRIIKNFVYAFEIQPCSKQVNFKHHIPFWWQTLRTIICHFCKYQECVMKLICSFRKSRNLVGSKDQ